jgi:hypothetical protein
MTTATERTERSKREEERQQQQKKKTNGALLTLRQEGEGREGGGEREGERGALLAASQRW